MRNVEAHLLEEKMDEVVAHYINSHPTGESVQVDANNLALNVQDESGRVLTIMHVDQHNYSPQVCRQVTLGEPVNGQWGEDLLDTDARLAAIVAHLQQRPSQNTLLKVPTSRTEVDGSVILDAPMRLFNGSSLELQTDTGVLEVSLPPMPSLQNMKRCSGDDWFNKGKANVKEQPSPPAPLSSPAHRSHNKKSLPHKKRISRRLKRSPGNTTPHQVEDIVVISCNGNEVPPEEILPDTFVPHQQSLQHITQEVQVRPIFICQLCGDFYGEEQLKFYQHLKQHYEPHIIIENPVPDLGIDKMTNTCVVDNSAALPDAIVELSLESTVPKTIYQTIDKHILYTSSDKTLNYPNNKVHYAMATIDKDNGTPGDVKGDLYESLDKLEIYSCGKCNRTFKKQKQCEMHIKEAHGSKLEDISEFSDPEDLMEGIHVSVSDAEPPLSPPLAGAGDVTQHVAGDVTADLHQQYEGTLLPHLTVENGHVHQQHARHWYGGRAACDDGGYCPVCPAAEQPHSPQPLKEEVYHRIFETSVSTDAAGFPDAVIETNIPTGRTGLPPPPASPPPPAPPPPPPPPPPAEQAQKGRKGEKQLACGVCGRVFKHRNSLFYHMLSHEGKQKTCKECGKSFYTTAALKIHKRVHNGDRPYKCDLCDKEFKQVTDLKYHKVSLHSTQKNHKCEFCGKQFARKYSLILHRRIHTGERNYKCDYCAKTFRASSYKISHMRSHTGVKPHECAECGKAFAVAGDLRRHTLTHEKQRMKVYGTIDNIAPNDKLAPPLKEEKQKNNTPNNSPKESTPTKTNEATIENDTQKDSNKAQNSKAKDKKPSKASKKNQIKKGAAPNVTVTNKLPNDPQFKMVSQYNCPDEFSDKIDVKIKEIYTANEFKQKEQTYNQLALTNYKDIEKINERDLLRTYKPDVDRRDNTDGKILTYTHVKTATPGTINLSEMRTFERDITREVRSELQGDGENGFLEKLTALYNIPAV